MDYILYELPSCQGWAYYNFLVEADPMGRFSRVSDGYVAQAWQAEFYGD